MQAVPETAIAADQHVFAALQDPGSMEVSVSRLGAPPSIFETRQPREYAMAAEGNFAFWAALSIVSSVGIILVNKFVMLVYGFNYVFTLTSMHFLCQAVVLELCAQSGVFSPSKMPTKENVLTALCGVASVVTMNFSLRTNSVGFYQMTKLMCIPCMVLVQSRYYSKVFSSKIKFSLLLVIAGVGITAVTDLSVRLLGLFFGFIAVLSTTQFQIWQGSKREEFGLTPIQITHSVSLPLAVITCLAALAFEVPGANSVLHHQINGWYEIGAILVSCSFAISVNICSFTLIGISSPVTYQVVGHVKTMSVLIGGILLFGFKGTMFQLMNNLIGIAVAMVGVVLYSHLKEMEKHPGVPDWIDRTLPVGIHRTLFHEVKPVPLKQTDTL